MEPIIKDDEKKESKIVKIIMICVFALLLIAVSICLIFNYLEFEGFMTFKDLVLSKEFIIFFLFALFCLYAYIYAVKYKVEIYEDKVFVSSLFGKSEIYFKDISEWEANKYALSNLFIIKVYLLNNKKKTVCTRYINEFKAILDEYKKNNIVEQNSNETSV